MEAFLIDKIQIDWKWGERGNDSKVPQVGVKLIYSSTSIQSDFLQSVCE